MPSPFPGMDPYIEMFEWEDFHVSFMVILSEEFHRSGCTGYVTRLAKRVQEDDAWKYDANCRRTFIVVRELDSREIVTTIELVAPTDKLAGTECGRLYAEKRLANLESNSHFVEIDLSRGGQRILRAEPGLPTEHDYYVFVSRAEQRPQIDLYSWRLQDRLPGIRIPLKPEHHLAYDRARYQNTLDYRQPLAPPIRPTDDAWLRSLLQSVTPASAT
jgi:hypothetical protein